MEAPAMWDGRVISILSKVELAHCFLRLCQVFPGSGSLHPTLWKLCFPVNTGNLSWPPGGHRGASIAAGMGTLSAVLLLSVWPFLLVCFLLCRSWLL